MLTAFVERANKTIKIQSRSKSRFLKPWKLAKSLQNTFQHCCRVILNLCRHWCFYFEDMIRRGVEADTAGYGSYHRMIIARPGYPD